MTMTMTALRSVVLAALVLLWGSLPAFALEEFKSFTLQDAAGATGNGTQVETASYASLALQVTISATATVTFEGTQDGSTWASTTCASTANTSGTLVTSVTATGLVRCNVAGLAQFRARVSSFGSGTVTATARVTTADLGGGGGGGGTQYAEDAAHTTGDTGTMSLCVRRDANTTLADTTGDYAPCQVDASGSLKVAIISGAGSGGTAMTDDAAFTPATTSITPAGAMFDDVTPDSVDEGDGGALRMSANRNLYSTIRDAAGNERGANVNASNELNTSANTELPAAAALADATANPTVPGVASYMMCWNSTTWDRCVASSNIAHDAVATSANPLLTGGYASAAAPTDVSADGDAVREWRLRNGAAATQPTYAGILASAGAGGTGTGVQRVIEANDSLLTTEATAIKTAVQLIDDDQTGSSINHRVSVGTTEDEVEIKATAGRLMWVQATNTNAAVRYLRCANLTAANTTPGTSTVFYGTAVPGATTGGGFNFNFGPSGLAFSTALTCWMVTGAAETDVAEVAANELTWNIGYK